MVNGGIQCADVSSGTCKPVGTVSANSPLYPHTLTGTAYYTSAGGSPGITLVIPPPFGLTLNGTYDVTTDTTTFTGIPDFPLTALDVTLSGGADGLFDSICAPPSGTITASLVSQNGDLTASPSAPFTIAGCHAATKPVTPGITTHKAGPPTLSSVAIGGVSTGKPTMRFTLTAGKYAAKLSSFTVKAPSGLSFVTHVVKHHATVTGVTVSGGKVKSLTLSHGQLVVVLRSATAGVTVKIGLALTESASLRSKVKSHKVKTLKLTVVTRDSARHSTTLARTVKVSPAGRPGPGPVRVARRAGPVRATGAGRVRSGSACRAGPVRATGAGHRRARRRAPRRGSRFTPLCGLYSDILPRSVPRDRAPARTVNRGRRRGGRAAHERAGST